MKLKDNCRRIILSIVAAGLISYSGFGQSTKDLEQLLPMDDVNQSLSKVQKQIMGLGAFVNITVSADINNYNSCSSESISSRGVQLKVSWYNTSDETGKFMLSTLKDLNGMTQEMTSFKNESGFNINEAKEEDFEGGKLWIISSQKECVNEITGPTGKTEYSSHLRFFVFNGNTMIKVELKGLSKPEKIKAMLSKIILEVNKFDFSTMANVVASE